MAILINADTKVICQGITGKAGAFHAARCLDYGTRLTAGVSPGKGGRRFQDRVPVFDTVAEAVRHTGADASMLFVPAPFAGKAIEEAAEAGIKLVACITEGIPQHDMLRARHAAMKNGAILIGPNSPGIIAPGECKIGIMPGNIHGKGRIGVISRSGTLTYEAVWQLTRQGLGQSTCVGIGGDPVHGAGFAELLELFENDPDTDGVLLLGEIGGNDEEQAAAWYAENGRKPLAAYIAGRLAPRGKCMGHAGAIVSRGSGSAEGKMDALRAAGATLCEDPSGLATTMAEALQTRHCSGRD